MEDQEFSQATQQAFGNVEDYSHIPKGETLDWTPEEEEEEALQVTPEEVASEEEEPVVRREQTPNGEVSTDGGILGSLGNAFNSMRGGDGSGGASNPIDSLVGDLRDVIDNTFQGDQLSREEINEKQVKGREEDQTGVIDLIGEPADIAAGAGIGALEQALGAAEVLGDTIKSIPSLVGLGEADGKQTPWSNQYEWAQWNLGKDEAAAQTPVGKIAQGFGEFAIIMGATGGFRSVAGVGAKWAAAGTKVQKAKVIASTAAKEGMYGMAADFIDGLGGNDNLSTLIKEHAPDWLPTWTTALAVDDGDGPYANAMKNMLEGFGLGSFIGGVGAPIAGMAAVRKLEEGVLGDLRAKGETLYHGSSSGAIQGIKKGGFKASGEGGNLLGSGVYFTRNEPYAKAYGEETVEGFTDQLKIYQSDKDSMLTLFEVSGAGRPTPFDVETGKALTRQQVLSMDPDDIAYDATAKQKKALREWVASKGYDGIEFNTDFTQPLNRSDFANEVLIFDTKKADEAVSGRVKDVITRQQKMDAFVEAAQKSLAETSSFNVPPGAKQVFNRLKELGDETHFQRYRPVMDQYEKGIPVTWDDIANVFPEYFTPATRQLPNDFNGGIYRAMDSLADGDGFTRNPFTGAEPAEGFAVAIDGASLKDMSPESVQAFLQKHADVLSREDVYLGAWKAPDTGVVELELSRIVPDKEQAVLLGQAFDQKAVRDIQGKQDIPTWGTDALRETQNGHLKGAMAAPSPSKTTPDYTKAAGDAISTPRSGQAIKTATRSPLTKSRIEAIKKGMGGAPDAINKKWFDSLVRKNRVPISDVSGYLKTPPREVGEKAVKLFNENFHLPYEEMNLPKMAFGQEEILTEEGIVTVNGLMKALSSELHKEIKAVGDLGMAGIDNTVHTIDMVNTLGALMNVHHQTSSIAGRFLYNHQIDIFGKKFNVPTKDLAKDERLFKTGMAKMDELLEALADGSPKARLKAQKMASQLALADGDPTKMRGIWNSFWIESENVAFKSFFNSLLSNFETHIVNGLSSTTNAWLRPLAGALGTGDFRHMRAAQWNFKKNIDEAWGQAMTAWKNGEPVSDTSKKMTHGVGSEETVNALAVLAETAEAQGDKSLAMGVKMMEHLHGMLDNPLLSWPSKLMVTTDEFMKAWTARIEYQNRTFAQALEAGDDTGRGLWDTFDALLEKKRADAIGADGEILDPDILRAAQEGNFQQALEGSAAQMGAALSGNPLARIFFPFVKTGHNITVFGMQHTPFLNRRLTEWKTIMDGEDEWAKAVLKGRERIGYGLVGSAGMLYMTGNITGAPDPNKTQREIQARPPYSIKVGGQWIDYSRMAPFDFPLRFVATVGDAVTKSRLSEEQGSYLMSYLAYTLSANLTQRSVTAGLRPLGILLNPQGNTAENIQATIAGIANSFVPASSQRRQVNNIFRPYKMEFENQMARFVDTFTFGGMGGGAIHHDMLDGAPVKNLNSGMNAVLNPMNVSDRGTSPGRDWLEDLQYDKNMVFTTLGGIKLKPAHRSAISKKMGELGLGRELDELAQNPKWERDRAAFTKLAQDGKLEADYKQIYPFYDKTHQLIMKYRDMALDSLQHDPEFAELADDIRFSRDQRRQTKFASRGANHLQKLAEKHGIDY